MATMAYNSKNRDIDNKSVNKKLFHNNSNSDYDDYDNDYDNRRSESKSRNNKTKTTNASNHDHHYHHDHHVEEIAIENLNLNSHRQKHLHSAASSPNLHSNSTRIGTASSKNSSGSGSGSNSSRMQTTSTSTKSKTNNNNGNGGHSNGNNSSSNNGSPRKHSPTNSKKSYENGHLTDSVLNVNFPPSTYTITEGVVDTTTSVISNRDENTSPDTYQKYHTQSLIQSGSTRFQARRRQSEADLKHAEEKEKRLQQLELLNTIGTGTFGRVMVARHSLTKEYFALKIMSIVEVVKLKQVDHVKNEKFILEQVKHPFIVKLYWTHHSEQYLYMLLEYVPGGELFSLLRQHQKFETKVAVFYAAEIVSALEYLHSFQIAYRDLKPENLLLDIEGHLKLTDFGFSKRIANKTFTLCGTPEYLAPEIIQTKGHNYVADWWALGVLIYEMLVGTPPFYDESPPKVYEKILQLKIEYPRYIDFSAKDLLKRLMTADPNKRLGSGNSITNGASFIQSALISTASNSSSISSLDLSSTAISSTASTNGNNNINNNSGLKSKSTAGAEEIKKHRWFVSISNWDDVYYRKLKPPFRPKILHEGDISNFEKYETPDLQRAPYASSKELDMFYEF